MSLTLVVDDDPGIRRLVKTALCIEGELVLLACDGLEALDILSREPVDLMVVDLMMPKMDGRLTVEEARREGYKGPILILSAYNAKSAVTDLLFDDCIEKPFELEDFMSNVRRLLRKPQLAASG